MSQQAYPYRFQQALGACIRTHRERMNWTLEEVVDLINESFHPDPPMTYHAQRIVEIPSATRRSPPVDILFWLYNLAVHHPPFLENPKTKQPFTESELLKIAQGKIDWETGNPVLVNS